MTVKPWDIDWYECRADNAEEAKAGKCGVGGVMWRRARKIGPVDVEHSHWGGMLLMLDEAEVQLVASLPVLAERLRVPYGWVHVGDGQHTFYPGPDKPDAPGSNFFPLFA